MDLKKFLSKSSETDQEYFWALSIETGWVQAGIWKMFDNKAEVVFSSQPVIWEANDELVNSCDTVLSSAIQNFPEDFVEPSKCVFGLSYSWIENGEISPSCLEKIKKVCVDLSLKPVGFVVIPEAIAHSYKFTEGVGLSSVVLGVYKDSLELSLFLQGKLVDTTQVARSVLLVDDVVEGLTRIKSENLLPPRILVYDGKTSQIDESSQELVKANWEDYTELGFLHPPKIEIITPEEKIKAISLAGASELNDSVNMDLPNKDDQTKNTDVSHQTKESVDYIPAQDVDSVSNNITAEDLGFFVDEDVSLNDPQTQPQKIDDSNLTPQETLNDMESNVTTADIEKLPPRKKFGLKIMKDIPSGFSKIFKLFPSRNFLSGNGNIFIFGIISMLLLFFAGIAWWWFFPKADVTIFVTTKKLVEDIAINIDTQIQDSVYDEFVLAGKLVEVRTSEEKTVETTGVKLVGDKAKGQISVYRAGPSLTLQEGTIFSGPNNLKFSLDQDVLIASGSAASAGETTVSVTATDIGSSYNLSSDTSFSIANYSVSDMEGKNKNSFSGGSSREVPSVSADDRNTLFDGLKTSLTQKAMEDLKQKVGDSNILIESSIKTTTLEDEYSHKVGDEASDLKLSLSLNVTGIVVVKDHLDEFAQNVIKDKVPEGFVLRSSQSEYSFLDWEEKDNKYTSTLKIVSNLLPQVNESEIAEKIKGKYTNIAEDYFKKEIPGFLGAQIILKPALPESIMVLPHVVKNIDVSVASKKS